ncbi:ferritin-like domain-containing protein [Pedobacter heparinus]|uniref:ferritin-like domain-containing protein n=1 Tax=Pedobacter heparinus TaxID=984 RepID=UPI00292E8F92|nr:ferritin-like domain-containing protein [Pedobacter heparinus]
MNILNILSEIEKVDETIYDRLNPRRRAIKDFYNMGKKISVAALPFALSTMLQKAYGQTTANTAVIESLNFALALEYMEFQFYNNALTATPNLIPVADKPIIITIRDHEQAHISLLIKTITDLGGTPRPAMPYDVFDYTKVATNVTTNYGTFLRTGVVLEDLGVRAYKGQAISLLGNNTVLAAATRIHSLEARHSAQLRQMVNKLQITNLKAMRPWVGVRRGDDGNILDPITNNDSMIGTLSPIYDRDTTVANSEVKTVQAGMDLVSISGFNEITAAVAAESFDELLLRASVIVAANLFIKGDASNPNKLK